MQICLVLSFSLSLPCRQFPSTYILYSTFHSLCFPFPILSLSLSLLCTLCSVSFSIAFFYLFPVIIVYQSSSFLFPSPWRLVVLFMTSSVRCPLIFPFLRPFLVPSPFIIHSKSSIHPYHHHLPFPTITMLYPPLFHIHVLSLSSYFPFLAHTTVQYIPV